MLSKPNVNDLMTKAGSRYEAALAVAKRAREISRTRVELGSEDIKDSVDLASKEIVDGKVLVKKEGEYILKEEITEEKIKEEVEKVMDIIEEDTDIVSETKKKKKKE